MSDSLSDRLDKIADLFSQGFNVSSGNTKSASADTTNPDSTLDMKTSLRMGIYMQAKKASYLNTFANTRKV